MSKYCIWLMCLWNVWQSHPCSCFSAIYFMFLGSDIVVNLRWSNKRSVVCVCVCVVYFKILQQQKMMECLKNGRMLVIVKQASFTSSACQIVAQIKYPEHCKTSLLWSKQKKILLKQVKHLWASLNLLCIDNKYYVLICVTLYFSSNIEIAHNFQPLNTILGILSLISWYYMVSWRLN